MKIKKRLVNFVSIVFVLTFCFSLVNAQDTGGTTPQTGGCPTPTDIAKLFDYTICIMQGYVVPFLIGLALVLFLAGIVKYVASGDNEEKRDAGRGLMIFGIIALFVMVGVWGLVKILHTTLLPGQEFKIERLPEVSNSPFQ